MQGVKPLTYRRDRSELTRHSLASVLNWTSTSVEADLAMKDQGLAKQTPGVRHENAPIEFTRKVINDAFLL
jgi:hypothetical protein